MRVTWRPWRIWLILALVFVVLFGYKKLPDASRSIGRSMRIFKAETKGLRGGLARQADGAATQPGSRPLRRRQPPRPVDGPALPPRPARAGRAADGPETHATRSRRVRRSALPHS